MQFRMPEYRPPDLSAGPFASSPDVALEPVTISGVAPEGFHATSIYPEYFKIGGLWVLAEESRMDCAVVVRDGRPRVTEMRRLEKGDMVVVGRDEGGRMGIYVHPAGFAEAGTRNDAFAFRQGRTRETSYSMDYDRLYELLEHEKRHGYTVWVAGPAVVFDYDSREALSTLISGGYVDVLLAGNALVTHDMEGSLYSTALGQNIYTQEASTGGHYHHLDTLNRVRRAGSIEAFLEEEGAGDGVVAACFTRGVPLLIAGSIRDDGPMPGTLTDVRDAQDAMRAHAMKATTVIGLATQLHTIAVGNMTPSYQVLDGLVRPVFMYVVDVSEFAVNKLRDRGSLEVISIVTNVQDFLVNLARRLD